MILGSPFSASAGEWERRKAEEAEREARRWKVKGWRADER